MFYLFIFLLCEFFLFQIMSLADFFQDETIFVAYGPERYYNDDFNLDENGR